MIKIESKLLKAFLHGRKVQFLFPNRMKQLKVNYKDKIIIIFTNQYTKCQYYKNWEVILLKHVKSIQAGDLLKELHHESDYHKSVVGLNW